MARYFVLIALIAAAVGATVLAATVSLLPQSAQACDSPPCPRK